jgi:thiol-disulfide isomerase/thioredoxin
VMNLNTFFDAAMPYDSYLTKLEGNLALHQLHYKKYTADSFLKKELVQMPPLKILVVSEPWCGDSLALLPIVYKMSEINALWQVKIIHRDENPELMDRFLTHGKRAIPIFLFLNSNGDLLFRWGPRPKAAQKIFNDHKHFIESGEIEKSAVIKKIRNYYAKDRGQKTAEELLRYLKKNMK